MFGLGANRHRHMPDLSAASWQGPFPLSQHEARELSPNNKGFKLRGEESLAERLALFVYCL
jgi:hypothetical protein